MSKKTKDTQLTGLDGIQKAKVRQDYTDNELVDRGSRLALLLDMVDRINNDLDEATIRFNAKNRISHE